MPDLVAHQDHRYSEREQRDGQEVLHLPVSQSFHRRIVGRAFDPAIPTSVVGRAVAIVLPVCLVVLAVVGNEVIEREAIVAGDEVDALLGLASLVAVDLGTADEPVSDPCHRTRLRAEEGADVVTEPSVPLLPAVSDEAADLVETDRIPRLGDELRARERRIRLDVPEDRRVRHRVPRRIARQDRRQIEPEPVDMHRLHPVPEAVDDHPADDGVARVERVPGAGVVRVPRAASVEDVVRLVIQSPEAERRPEVITFRGVVEDDVENHLDPRPVQGLDHVAELVDRAEPILT